MSRIRVFICTKDQRYGEQIVRYAATKCHSEIQFEQRTEITEKTEFQKSDVVVSDDDAFLHGLDCHKVWIVRQKEKESEGIFMYQSRENIYRQLIQKIGVREAEAVPKVVCVFSPEGGDEKTLLAIHRALKWGKEQRVLYISLCGFPVFFRKEISPNPAGVVSGVSELFLCTQQAEFEGQLKQLSFDMGNICMIPPVEHYKDLLDFSKEEVMQFVKHLQKQTLYDVVVLEMGQLFEYTFELLAEAGQVLVPQEPGFLAEVRRNVFRDYCCREGKEAVWERLKLVPVSFPRLEDLEEVNQIFFGEEGADGAGGALAKGKNTKSRLRTSASRRGT